jgi:menaquinone-9 beta-reductase
MYDLIVIGGGPAGSAAAITAARTGARVLLLERGKYPRHKVCGEFVSPESLGILKILLEETQFFKSQKKLTRIGRGRIFVDRSVLEMFIDPPAASIARIDLDSALWNAALTADIDARQQQSVQNVAGNGPFVVSTGTDQFEARSVINASGRWSNLSASKSQGTNGSGPKWLGLKAHFAGLAVSPSVDLYFFQAGYCGVQPLGMDDDEHETRMNACAMVRSDAASSLAQVFSLHPALHKCSRQWRQISEAVATSPLLFRKPDPLCDGMLLAGDAAGFVDPFVGDGISLALRSGAMAGSCLQAFFTGKASLNQARQEYRRKYELDMLPVFRSSSRIRRLFSLPSVVRIPLAHLFQHTPALTRYLVRKTRGTGET